MNERIAIGLDLGGTYIKAGILTEKGKSLGQWKEPTNAASGPEAVLGRLLSITHEILESDELKEARDESGDQLVGIGIGSPGIVDARSGVILLATDNLPGWTGTKIGPMFEDEFNVSVFVDNDANAYVYGEYLFGAGRGKDLQSMIGLTLGTGVGGGVILDGRIFHGGHGCAGELGHIVVSNHKDAPTCSMPIRGCLEGFVSAKAIVEYAGSRRENFPNSLIFADERMTPRMIHDAALRSDELALEIVDRMAYYLGRGLASLVSCFDPELIVIGGGVAGMGKLLFERVEKVMRENVYFMGVSKVQIRAAQLGSDGGYKGAAALALFPGK